LPDLAECVPTASVLESDDEKFGQFPGQALGYPKRTVRTGVVGNSDPERVRQ
jgi:hypothetical protein